MKKRKRKLKKSIKIIFSLIIIISLAYAFYIITFVEEKESI